MRIGVASKVRELSGAAGSSWNCDFAGVDATSLDYFVSNVSEVRHDAAARQLPFSARTRSRYGYGPQAERIGYTSNSNSAHFVCIPRVARLE